jgi:hypothetical protein
MQGGPFNFYGEVSGIVYSEGAATPFGLFYVNQSGIYGVYFPQNIALGAPLHLLNDGDTSPTKYAIKQSGNVDKELKDIPNYLIKISGDSFPSTPDLTNTFIVINGNITGNTPDKVLFNIGCQGDFQACLIDVPNLSVTEYGNVALCPKDNYSIFLTTSGNISTFKTDINNYSLNFNGNLRGGQKDNGNINFQMYNMSFEPGLQEIIQNTSDLFDFSFVINTISFNRAE